LATWEYKWIREEMHIRETFFRSGITFSQQAFSFQRTSTSTASSAFTPSTQENTITMRFTNIIYAAFAATAIAAPTATEIESRQLLLVRLPSYACNLYACKWHKYIPLVHFTARKALPPNMPSQDLSPGIQQLVTGLGLPGVGKALSDTLVTLSKDLKKRDIEELETRGPLLSDLVSACLTRTLRIWLIILP
jgi:hypothetical protein